MCVLHSVFEAVWRVTAVGSCGLSKLKVVAVRNLAIWHENVCLGPSEQSWPRGLVGGGDCGQKAEWRLGLSGWWLGWGKGGIGGGLGEVGAGIGGTRACVQRKVRRAAWGTARLRLIFEMLCLPAIRVYQPF